MYAYGNIICGTLLWTHRCRYHGGAIDAYSFISFLLESIVYGKTFLFALAARLGEIIIGAVIMHFWSVGLSVVCLYLYDRVSVWECVCVLCFSNRVSVSFFCLLLFLVGLIWLTDRKTGWLVGSITVVVVIFLVDRFIVVVIILLLMSCCSSSSSSFI